MSRAPQVTQRTGRLLEREGGSQPGDICQSVDNAHQNRRIGCRDAAETHRWPTTCPPQVPIAPEILVVSSRYTGPDVLVYFVARKKTAHIRRRGRLEFENLPRHWMRERYTPGVQCLP